jgi:hypothetical protein
MKTIIGIDTGASGGIAWWTETGVGCEPMPDTEGDILQLLRCVAVNEAEVYIEQNFGFVAGGTVPSSAMFTMGRNVGFIHGVIAALGCRVIEVRPQVWQKALGLGVSGKQKPDYSACATVESCQVEKKRVQQINSGIKRDWKNKLKAKAQQLFPHLKVTLKTCDALLLLEDGKMTTKL